MNILESPKVAALLGQLHREADAQKSSVRTVVKEIREEQTSQEDFPSDWERLGDFYIPVTPEQGRFLYRIVREKKPQSVVELGTSFGISTLYVAAALHDNQCGKIVSAELIARKAEKAMANIRAAGLSDYVDIRTGDAFETLSSPEQPIDILFPDAGPELNPRIIEMLRPHIRKDGLLLLKKRGEIIVLPVS